MKLPVKIGLGILIIVAVGSGIYFSKPTNDKPPYGGEKSSTRTNAGQKADATSNESGQIPPPMNEPAEKQPELSKEEIRQQAKEVAEMLRSISTTEGSGQGPSAKEHEKTASTVRPAVAQGLLVPLKVKRPQATPTWSSPTKLNWKELSRLHLGWVLGQQVGKDFNDETIRFLSGAAVTLTGAVMPIDPVPTNGRLKRFWLAHPRVVTDGCVFCNPPTLGDLVYVSAKEPFVVNREKLYKSIVHAEVTGLFELGPSKTQDGIEYLFGLTPRETRTVEIKKNPKPKRVPLPLNQ